MSSLLDIRVGTMLPIHDSPRMAAAAVRLGFESLQLGTNFSHPRCDFGEIAKRVREATGDAVPITAIGFYANVIADDSMAKVFASYIDQAPLFGTSLVCGFTGAIDGKPMLESVPAFKKRWSELGKRAADNGVRIAFENCEMLGTWRAAHMNLAHGPDFWDIIWNELPTDRFGLCWEPCHQLGSLIDPIPQLRKLVAGKHVFNIHGKDATVAWDVVREKGIQGGTPYVWQHHPGFGETNWTNVINILRRGGYAGSIDIEGWHDLACGGDLEWTGQVQSLKYLQKCRGGTEQIQNP